MSVEKKDTAQVRSGDVSTVAAAVQVLEGQSKKNILARVLPFMGPAFIASIAYMDPGNFAVNIQGGAQFGYLLIWVIIASNLMAMFVQALSAKLGIASGMNLAELCREHFPQPVVVTMWVIAEIAAMATDLAEFLGAAIGFYLLFHIPLLVAGILTAIVTFIILGLERYGFRPLEAVITAFVGVIALSYVVEIFIAHPDWSAVGASIAYPHFEGTDSVLLASGILGATVMPHVIFLHSALTQGRIVTREPKLLRRLYGFELFDILIAMGAAGFINVAMLIMAAATFFAQGLTSVGTIEEAHRTLEPLLGSASSWIFAVSLLASGLSSSAVGTMAGQVIMQGFMRRHIAPWLRRLVTMLPSLIVIAIGLDPTRTLVLSQVLLSFGLPFAVIPLVIFTARKDVMGVLVNNRVTTILAIAVAALIVALNLFLIYQSLFGEDNVFKRFLVPLDGSTLAESVLPTAKYFATCFDATVVLFHALEQGTRSTVHGERHLLNLDEAETYLEDIAARFAAPNLKIETDVHPTKEADVARSIINHIEELRGDLVVLCAHGGGRLRDVFVGNIAQQVVARGTTPVLFVHPRMENVPTFECRKILIPLDSTPHHEPTLPIASDIARQCGSTLNLLTVVPTTNTLSAERAGTGMLLPTTMSAVLDLAQRGAVEYLQTTAARLLADGIATTAQVIRGDPASSILQVAKSNQSDLIVLATHGRTNAGAFWSGSVTPKILSRAHIPVLLVRMLGEEAER